MTDTLDKVLANRTALIAEILAPHIGSKWEWWGNYHRKEGLYTARWTDTSVEYRRSKHTSPILMLSDIQPKGLRNKKESEPILLSSKMIDSVSIRSDNSGSDSPLDYSYRAEFEKLTSKEEAFAATFEQSIRNCFTAGNDTSPVKNELEITLGFSQETSTSESESERVNRENTISGSTPPGVSEIITARRQVGRMKSTVTGIGDYEHSIRIGKHWHGSWQGHKHRWDSLSDLIRVMKGEAPTNMNLAREFAKRPAPDNLIKLLEHPLDLPYIQVLEFDEATAIEQSKSPIN